MEIEKVHYNQYNYPIMNFIVYFEEDRLYVPEYQRGKVWDIEKYRLLIQSIMENLPIGNIFLNRRYIMSNYEIVDGQQRLNVIKDFYLNRFRWNGKLYKELSDIEQFQFKQFTMAVYVTNYKNVRDIIELYYRINWSGVEHTLDELLEIQNIIGQYGSGEGQ